MIPVAEAFAEWWQDPKYVEAYDALEGEFSAVAAAIEMRMHKAEAVLRGSGGK